MAKAVRRGVAALLGLGLVVVATMLLVESPWARHWLEGQVSQRLNGRAVAIGALDIDWGWPLTVRLEEVSVDNSAWARQKRLLHLASLSVALDTTRLLQGRVELESLALVRPELHLRRHPDGRRNWTGLLGTRAEAGSGSGRRPERVSVERGRLTYHDPARDIGLSVALQTGRDGTQAPGLIIAARGVVRGQSLRASGRGAPLEDLMASRDDYPLAVDARLGQVRARLDGRLDGAHLVGRIELVAAEEADLAGLVGRPGLDLPALDLTGRLDLVPSRWALDDIDGHLGESHVAGTLAFVPGGRPRLEARLRADRLSLERWGITRLRRPEERRETEREIEETLEEITWNRRWAQLLAPLRRLDAELELAVGRLGYGDTLLEDVAVDGRLEANRLDLERLHVARGQSALTTRGWLEVGAGTLAGDLDTRVTRLDLGELLAPLGYPEAGTLDGRLRVRITEATLAFDDTSLDYRAPAQSLALTLNAETAPVTGDTVPGVHLRGRGRYRDEPFAYDLTVGPLLDLNAPDRPYPVRGLITSRDTRLRVDGSIQQPLQLAAVTGRFQLSGPSPSRLTPLLGLTLPELPPYELSGEVQVRENRVRLRDARGRVGDSDLAGELRLHLGERHRVQARLMSRRLDLDDLGPLVGLAPDTGPGEEASPEQRRRARQQARRPGVFPDRRWNLAGLRRMDAEVTYRAASVNARHVPLSDVAVDLALERGRLTLAPLRVGLGGGEVTGRARLDARGEALQGDLAIALRRVNLKPLLQRAGLPEVARDSAGTLGGEGALRFRGRSLDESMASLDGTLELAMAGGRLDMLLIEAIGLDVGEALLAALSESQQVAMRCAYARLDSDRGRAALQQLFIDTDDSNLTGGGAIDLDAERLELVFEAHPKDVSLPASNSPVTLRGPLEDPRVEVVSRELVARGVLSVLGALIAPPLAILPWIEPGTGESVGPGCRRVLEDFPATPAGDS
ncbi:AsmA family protein [Halomonas stenophila]|uniref:Uncharacterized protein involved in outer membrane biogenesis n=1 Tax=Halomonas stenophila TaxID=795312 RepID=A0A7W5ERD5_9GAMM|nr:uncharacterized protein involved in outer membrane biogenesis [Halomonas stenophila]